VPTPTTYIYLLDSDEDLARGLDVRMRIAARRSVTAMVIECDPGECELQPWLATIDQGPGLLVLTGLMAVDVHIGERTATELVGPGDLLQPPAPHTDDLLERRTAWHALTSVRMAVLDVGFSNRVHPWPQITQELLRRAGQRGADLDALRAIAGHPRLEIRIVLLLWHLAARWGRVEPGGIRLTMPLTHRMLGQLVGAERPSVSHALARLATAGLLTSEANDWHLHGTPEEQFERLVDRAQSMSRPSARSVAPDTPSSR
jgi:hypothetical protein